MISADFPAPWAHAAERALDDLLAGRTVVVKRDALEQDLLAAFVVAAASITPDHLRLMGRLGGDIVWVALGRHQKRVQPSRRNFCPTLQQNRDGRIVTQQPVETRRGPPGLARIRLRNLAHCEQSCSGLLVRPVGEQD